MGIKYCDGKRLRRAFRACAEWLTTQEEEVNRINVFPVPDGDTGTNMSSTLKEALINTLDAEDISLNRVAQEFAEATFVSAKGCSGIIISQFFKGFCKGIDGKERINAKELAQCFVVGSQYAYKAVIEPKEGTILTIIREMSKKAEELTSKEDDIIKMLNMIIAHAKDVLKKTTYLLPELKEAKVVDAGGLGFIGIIEGVVKLIEGEITGDNIPGLKKSRTVFKISPVDIKHQYCCEIIIKEGAKNSNEIQREIAALGSSLLIIEDEENLKVHLHTDYPGKLIDALHSYGELFKIKVDNMKHQHEGLAVQVKPKIVTDSTSDLPEDLTEMYGITVVPLSVCFGDETYLDGVDITSKEFYAKLKNTPKIPVTSQPSPEQFIKTYQNIDRDIISLHISSKISGTFNSALMGKKNLKRNNIVIIDSSLASSSLGLLVLESAKIIKEGKDLEEVVNIIEQLKTKIKTIFTLDTLEYLQKGGRIGKTKELMANLLNIKPILTMKEGVIVPLGKVRRKDRVIPEIIKIMRQEIKSLDEIRVIIAHADCSEEANILKSKVEEGFKCQEIIMSKIGAVIGTHVGPGALGISYYVV